MPLFRCLTMILLLCLPAFSTPGRVTMECESAPLPAVLREVARSADLKLEMDALAEKTKGSLTLKFKDQSLELAMIPILKGTKLSWYVQGHSLFIGKDDFIVEQKRRQASVVDFFAILLDSLGLKQRGPDFVLGSTTITDVKSKRDWFPKPLSKEPVQKDENLKITYGNVVLSYTFGGRDGQRLSEITVAVLCPGTLMATKTPTYAAAKSRFGKPDESDILESITYYFWHRSGTNSGSNYMLWCMPQGAQTLVCFGLT